MNVLTESPPHFRSNWMTAEVVVNWSPLCFEVVHLQVFLWLTLSSWQYDFLEPETYFVLPCWFLALSFDTNMFDYMCHQDSKCSKDPQKLFLNESGVEWLELNLKNVVDKNGSQAIELYISTRSSRNWQHYQTTVDGWRCWPQVSRIIRYSIYWPFFHGHHPSTLVR